MKIIGKKGQGDLIAIEFSEIEKERYDKNDNEKCHLLLRGYNYQFYYVVFKTKPGQEMFVSMSNEEAENIIEKAIKNEFVDLRDIGQFVVVDYERFPTVFIRNDVNEFDDEDIPIVVSIDRN